MGNACYKYKNIQEENKELKLQIKYMKEILVKKDKDLLKLKQYIIESKKQIEIIRNKIKDII
jgi:hypothetical protein